MPTYEYVCKRCEHRFERFQNMTDTALEKCPACGGSVERQIGAGAGLLVKGGVHDARERTGANAGRPNCGRDRPCCGREQRCDKPTCRE